MKVVQVSHLYRPSLGGIENYSYRLSMYLEDKGNKVEIITTDASLSNESSPLTREANATYCPTTVTLLRNPFSIHLHREVRRRRADIYHVHSPWYLTSLEAVHAIEDTPTVMTIHGFQPLDGVIAETVETMYRPFAKYILSSVDHVIALGAPDLDRLVSGYDTPREKVSVIPNGIHPDEHDVSTDVVERFREEHGLNLSTPTILYVSRIVPLKGPQVLVDAVTRHLADVDLNVVIVGSGDPNYVANVRSAADGRFTFLSNLPFEELQAAYHAADMFVLPSNSEGLPTVVLEAMNARLPVITTPVGALPDVIDDGENGWLLESPPDAEEVAESIRYYVEHSSERRKTGARNRDRVRERFNWADIAEQIESLYHEVANSK